ncbi:MAG: ABC transporter permease [Clostridia bacterium]|jgi:spermidine/putrescine transport system permease protein|nr:ABC transporter permease [Clostridia bacterium]MCI1998941.1 ABC transporter permease [Clostridia bacterium]MCI2013691.1 ABC transporter permease [Clostridia bacterium]
MKQFRSMAYPYIIWICIMIVAPMLLIMMYAFTTKGNDVTTFRFTIQNFIKFFSDDIFVDVLRRSLLIAVITTIICFIIGYPTAYVIAKASGRKKIMLIMFVTIPTWINMLVRTYAWMGMLQNGGIISKLFSLIGIDNLNLLHTSFAVVLGMVYNFIPFMILQIYTSLSKMDYSLIEAANDLGANNFQTFIRVVFPLSLPGVISGITLVFLPAVSSFFIPKLLGGGQYVLIGNVIENEFLTSGDWNFGSAISIIMTIIIMVSMYITKKIDVGAKIEGGDAK